MRRASAALAANHPERTLKGCTSLSRVFASVSAIEDGEWRYWFCLVNSGPESPSPDLPSSESRGSRIKLPVWRLLTVSTETASQLTTFWGLLPHGTRWSIKLPGQRAGAAGEKMFGLFGWLEVVDLQTGGARARISSSTLPRTDTAPAKAAHALRGTWPTRSPRIISIGSPCLVISKMQRRRRERHLLSRSICHSINNLAY
jgi:hypothetical protein